VVEWAIPADRPLDPRGRAVPLLTA
jgi:hypothetical protein